MNGMWLHAARPGPVGLEQVGAGTRKAGTRIGPQHPLAVCSADLD